MPSEEILALCPDRNGSIWIGTSRGLIKYDTSWSRLPALSYDDKPPRAPLLLSEEGVIYTGADEGVLEKEGRKAEWLGPDEGITGTPTVLFEDSEGMIWLGTDRGLYLYDRGLEEHFLPPDSVWEAVERGHGVVDAVKRRYYDRHTGLKDERIRAIGEDGEGGIWVGTAAGLSRYHDGRWDLLEENEVLGLGEITALAAAGESLWVGTPSGLWLHDESEWVRVSSPGAPGEEWIMSLLLEPSGSLWVGTERGVYHKDGEEWTRYDESSGLIGGSVAAIYRDGGGVLWFGTDAGVVKHDGSRWSAFSEADGLHANVITDIIGVGEEIWFASPEGVSTYRPDRAPPDTRIGTIPGEVVGVSSFLFEFAGSDFETPPHRMQYSWRFDVGPWSPFSEAPRVTVGEMVNGTHTFSVRAMDQGLNIDPSPAEITFQVDTGLFDLELVEAEFVELYASLYQFYASDRGYADRPAARITVRNNFDQDLRVKVSLFVPGLMDFPTDRIATVEARGVLDLPLRIELSEEVLSLEKSSTRQALLTMQYSLRGELKESSTSHPVTIFEKHSMTWEEPERIGLYVTHLDEAVENFARGVVGIFREEEKEAIIYDNLLRGIEIFDALGSLGVRYIADPDNPYGGFTVARPALDLVRYPRETLRARSGDCDDVSVLYAALLQNIGIDTALVDVFDHVFVLFDTGLKRGQERQLTKDPGLLHVDGKDRIWIPVEVTLLGKTFTEAWKTGARMLAERSYRVVEMKKAWEKYAPLQLGGEVGKIPLPTREQIGALFDEDLRLQEQTLVSEEIRRLRDILKENPGNVAVQNSLGVMLARKGYLRQAAGRFRRVIELAPSFAGGHGNLANVLYEQEKYEEAIRAYLESLRLDPASPEVNVELALTYCEVGRFGLARKHYGAAMDLSKGSGDAALLHDAGAAEN
jgi:tetratricopeptide (TPR) repeat protein